jgi:hypothetical protein
MKMRIFYLSCVLALLTLAFVGFVVWLGWQCVKVARHPMTYRERVNTSWQPPVVWPARPRPVLELDSETSLYGGG